MIITIIIAKLIEKILRLLGRGATTFPGKIALALNKNILKQISENVKIIIITGTNGKTTTARIVEEGLKTAGKSYFLNRSGANLITGITTSFLMNCKINGKCKCEYAVIECDENALKKVSLYLDADILAVTNIFRDQLDRYGEVSHTLEAIKTGAQNMRNAVLVLNADDPLSFSLSSLNKKYYTYGINIPLSLGGRSDSDYCVFCKSPYGYKSRIYSQLGDFYCTGCGYKREMPNLSVEEIIELKSDFSKVFACFNGKNAILKINLGGVYNIYNALCASAVLSLAGLTEGEIEVAVSSFSGAFGRMEQFGDIRILLVKNPTGLTQAVNYIYQLDFDNVVFVLNDNDADGRDVSWIWDADIKINPNVKHIYTFGIRSGDMALRLKYAGFNPEIIKSHSQFHNICKSGKTAVVPTYTAMMKLRPYFAKLYNKERFWK